jgi:hypothetical protein
MLMKGTTKENPTARAVEKELGPFIKLLASKTNAPRPTKSAIADRLSKITGKPVTRQMVEKWLHPDPEKRTQALHGTGILLVKLLRELCR